MDAPRSADALVASILAPGTLEQIQAAPKETLTKLAAAAVDHVDAQVPRVLDTDRTVYRIVVLALGAVVILVVLGVIVLALRSGQGTPFIPEVLTALGSAAIGALAGILAPGSR